MAELEIMLFGEGDVRAREQLERCMEEASYGVLCADHHVGYSAPIGAAIAYPNHVLPSGVGYDIGCGNMAVGTNLKVEGMPVGQVMDEIVRRISFGMGRVNNEPVVHPVLEKIRQANFVPQRSLLQLAENQLGTVGSGNHYVDLFEDEDGWLWIGVHFGSRGFGHKTATGFLAMAEGKKFTDRPKHAPMDVPPVLLEADSEIGQAYISAMQLAGDYAYAGREVVVLKVLEILGLKDVTVRSVHNHHNYAWKETHFGEQYWVVRKGTTPAFPDQEGFVGSSMGGTSVILRGVDSEKSRQALYSTVHGAGRAMSRTQAAGKRKWNKAEKRMVVKSPGLVDWEAVQGDLGHLGIDLRGGGADEAPESYKDLDEVLEFHEGTIEITHRLRPVGVAMAGADVHDPFRD